jgi:glutamate racemase
MACPWRKWRSIAQTLPGISLPVCNIGLNLFGRKDLAMDSRAIGIYDSGMGGLSVLKMLKTMLPHENFIYFADTANLPYGNKSTAQIVQYSRRIISFMQHARKVKLVVAACHTSSALAIETIQGQFEIPIVGMIQPMIAHIMAYEKYQKIGIIATQASCQSKAHALALVGAGFSGKVYSISCPEFASLIENNIANKEMIKQKAKEYLGTLAQGALDTLIYGCTHYSFIKDIIEKELPADMQYIDPAEHVAMHVKEMLTLNNLANKNGNITQHQFYCSGNAEDFAKKAFNALGLFVKVEMI